MKRNTSSKITYLQWILCTRLTDQMSVDSPSPHTSPELHTRMLDVSLDGFVFLEICPIKAAPRINRDWTAAGHQVTIRASTKGVQAPSHEGEIGGETCLGVSFYRVRHSTFSQARQSPDSYGVQGLVDASEMLARPTTGPVLPTRTGLPRVGFRLRPTG